MSYRNPKFFYEDFSSGNFAMQKTFQDTFTNVYSYFQNKIDERKLNIENANEAQIKNQEIADGLESTDAGLTESFNNVINEVTTISKEFSVSGTGKLFDDKLGVFGDKSTQNFQTEQEQLQTANSLTSVVDGIRPAVTAAAEGEPFHATYDQSTPDAIIYGSIVNTFKNGINRDGTTNFTTSFDRDSNKINASLTVNNPYYFGADTDGGSGLRDVNEGLTKDDDAWTDPQNTYKPQDIQRIAANNDPSLRVAADKGITDKVGEINNQIKTSLNEWEAENKGKDWYSIKGANVAGSEYIDGKVDELWSKFTTQGDEVMMGEDDFVTDIITNKLNYNQGVMMEFVDKNDFSIGEGENKKEGFLNSLTLVDGQVHPKRAEVLSMLMETNPNDKKMMSNLLFSLGVERGSEEMDKAMVAINNAQNQMAKKWFKDEILKGELGAKYVAPKKPDKPAGPAKSGDEFNPNDPYVVLQGETTAVWCKHT